MKNFLAETEYTVIYEDFEKRSGRLADSEPEIPTPSHSVAFVGIVLRTVTTKYRLVLKMKSEKSFGTCMDGLTHVVIRMIHHIYV